MLDSVLYLLMYHLWNIQYHCFHGGRFYILKISEFIYERYIKISRNNKDHFRANR